MSWRDGWARSRSTPMWPAPAGATSAAATAPLCETEPTQPAGRIGGLLGGEGEMERGAAGDVLAAARGGQGERALLLGGGQLGQGRSLVGQLENDAGAVRESQVVNASQHPARRRPSAA
jgi:hypothetical protein